MQRMLLVLSLLIAIAIAFVHGDKYTHEEALAKVTAGDVKVYSSGRCSDRRKRRCTSLDQIRVNTLQSFLVFRRAVGSSCPVTISGGTEIGHASGTYSHWNGYKLDIRLVDCVNNYITTNFFYVGNKKDGTKVYKTREGDVYSKEGNHWDILYYDDNNVSK